MRLNLLFLVFALAAAIFASDARAQTAPVKAVELTFLRSHEPDPAALVSFIEANWFALDREAQIQGLMTGFEVVAAPRGDDQAWNVIVKVEYPTCAGYGAIVSQFAAIRSRHVPVAVGGKTSIRDFGAVMETRRLHPPNSGC